MDIEKLTLKELPTVLDLLEVFDRTPAPRPEVSQMKNILDQLLSNGGAILGAKVNGEIVGTCTIAICPNLSWTGRPYAMIENVIVAKEYRMKGIGKALLNEAKKMAKEAGCYKIALMTGSQRKESFKFYEALGFVGNKAGFQKRFDA